MDEDLDDYKLDTTWHQDPSHVVHNSFERDRRQRGRKAQVENKWYRQEELGFGSCGVVYLETTEDGAERAVKCIRKSMAVQLKIDYRRELAAISTFSRAKYQQHKIFVEFLGWFENPEYIFLAMEYLPLGDLSKHISENIKENDLKDISTQLLEGLKLMHAKGFTHRDLKPQNIFIVQMQPSWWVKIGDFGIAKRVRDGDATELRTATGTQGYEAPEIRGYIEVDEHNPSSVYTNVVDIWSFGCVIYKTAANRVPFPTGREIKRFCDDRMPFPAQSLQGILTADGVEFLRSVLVARPLARPTAEVALKHPWFQIKDEVVAPPPRQRLPSPERKATFSISPAEIEHQTIPGMEPILNEEESYRSGILQTEVDANAPVVKVGIILLIGAGIPSVTKAELRKASDVEPFQKSPEWRVFTAATLLSRFEVGNDLLINQKDDSAAIVQRKRQSTRAIQDKVIATLSGLLGRQNTADQGGGESREIIERDIQDQTLTIDSDEVKLLHGFVSVDQKFDITCTLVEIDMFSMRDLMTNYRTIVESGGRSASAKDIIVILDVMINDVRRLYTRSPQLFQMATRSLIANSVYTRYGVDDGTNFVTLTTSASIRKLIDKSTAYFLSLIDSGIDQEIIMPKFLQMIVLLLSFLGNEDLKNISAFLESTFRIPGDREYLELLILKVLPLTSINSGIFLEGLVGAYIPLQGRKEGYTRDMHAKIWAELQEDLVEKGYIVPVPIESLQLSTSSVQGHTNPPAPPRIRSWQAPWPRDGVRSSTIFRYLQHDGMLRGKAGSRAGSFRAMNDIPYLRDHDDKLQVCFTNEVQYRVSAEEVDLISAMQEGHYTLSGLKDYARADLEIACKTLNGKFIHATRELNILLQNIFNMANRGYLGLKVLENDLFQNNTSLSISLITVEEPMESVSVQADIVSPTGVRQCVAEVFKLDKRALSRTDILRHTTSFSSRVRRGAERIESGLDKMDTDNRQQKPQAVVQWLERTATIKRLLTEAETRMLKLDLSYAEYPEDPIKKVTHPTFGSATMKKQNWQNYQVQLSKGRERMFVKSKKLIVEAVSSVGEYRTEVAFTNLALKLCVEPLESTEVLETKAIFNHSDVLLWMGYYVVLVEPVETVKNAYRVLGYFRVHSQISPLSDSQGSNFVDLNEVVSVLI